MRALPADARAPLRGLDDGVRRVRAAGLLACGAAVASLLVVAAGARAAPYRIDERQSEFVVLVSRAGVGSALAHDHVVRATRFSGSLDVDRELVALSAEIEVDARALEVDEPEQRAKYGLSGRLSEEDRAEVRTTMLGEGQLDVERYPEIRFRASQIERAPEGFRLTGDLTLHGVTRRVSFPMQVREEGEALHGTGSLRFKQSDFGIEPYSVALGAIRNRDEVELRFGVVALPSGGG